MPALEWIGKQAVVNHHRVVPYRLVHCDGDLSAGDPEAGNLLVQGDNLEALRALLPYYAAKVKCIYIDPPYNTGNEGWVYNDNVNSPEIRAWLGRAVGKEAEDLSRHDKWLCMMYPRLRLLREFMRDDGVIFVSIDDEEVFHARMLMNEIFGAGAFIAQFVWKSRVSEDTRALSGVSTDHEYILAYSGRNLSRLRGVEKDSEKFTNPDNDERGPWRSADLTGLADANARPNLHCDLIDPDTGINYGCPPKGWRFDPASMAGKIAEGRILWPKEPSGRPRHKLFYKELGSLYKNTSSVLDFVSTAHGTREVNEILGHNAFQFPKPSQLIQFFIEQATESEDLVLDSFAGSGTTGQAVLDLNKKDGGKRRFILVEMEEQVARNVTAERLRRVIEGYDRGGKPAQPVEGLGGGFRFCQLGTPLFDDFGDIASEVTFPDLAAHIFFAETGVPIPKRAKSELLGVHQSRAVYLLFDEGHPQTPREAIGNVLTPDRLAKLPMPSEDFEGIRVVYAEGCTVSSDRLKAAGVAFKQIHYQLEGA